jgi:hypothetical protein
MPISATDPTTVPAAPAATYGLWWMWAFSLDGSDPSNVQAMVTLRKYALAQDGVTIMFSPVPTDQVTISLGMLMQVAEGVIAPSNVGLTQPSAMAIAMIMTTLLAGVEACGRDLGVL